MAKLAVQVLMQKLETGMPDKDIPPIPRSNFFLQHRERGTLGFTLIEILIVMLIIGIILGFAVVRFDGAGDQRRAKILAEEFVEYIHLLQYQALLENTIFGVQWLPDGYQSVRLTSDGGWNTPSERQLQKRSFPAPLIARLDAPTSTSKASRPRLLIHPSGDVTTFRLYIGTPSTPQIAQVIGSDNGEIMVQ